MCQTGIWNSLFLFCSCSIARKKVKRNIYANTGIHTVCVWGGGGEMGDFPLLKLPPSPLLNKHKYYKKVVLKHKQQQSDSCCSKKVCTCSKRPIIFLKVYSSGQNIGNRQFPGRGARWFSPPFRIILYETLANSIVPRCICSCCML